MVSDAEIPVVYARMQKSRFVQLFHENYNSDSFNLSFNGLLRLSKDGLSVR